MIYKYFLLLVLLFILSFTTQASSRKVALVIGNANYAHSPLSNPINDANDISLMLGRLGFDVILGIDLNRQQLRVKIREFGKKLLRSDMGFFYYAGHGVQSYGENYLIPLQADIMSEAEIPDEAISANSVLRQMDRAQNKVNIIILDACRNNPFASSFRAKNSGLVGMYGPVGSYIAYATSPGKTAADGSGRNGLYTQYLLKYMQDTELGIEQVMKKVRIAVSETTNGKQVPWENSSLMGNFFFSIDGVFEQNKSVIDGVGYMSAVSNDKQLEEKENQKVDNNTSSLLSNQNYIYSFIFAIVIVILAILFFIFKRNKKQQTQKTKSSNKKPSKQHSPNEQKVLNQLLAVGHIVSLPEQQFICDILPDKTISFGRDIIADITLERDEASRLHGKIGWDEELEQFWIEDLNSKNGTFISDVNKQFKRIPSSQRITITTDQSFYFIDDKSCYQFIKKPLLTADETVCIDLNSLVDNKLSELTKPDEKAKEKEKHNEIKCYIKKLSTDNSGIEQILSNINKSSKIIFGRDDNADIKINQQQVSRQHTLVYWDEELQQCMIKDLGSANGTWLANNQRLPKNQALALADQSCFYIANDQQNAYMVNYL